MEWPKILDDLERELDRLARDGVGFVNILPDGEQGAGLDEHPPGDSAPAEAGAPPLQSAGMAPATPHRAAALAARLQGNTPATPGPEGAVPAAEAALAETGETLDQLAARFAACDACRLSQGRNRLVFGCGSPHPKLLFIGEGPGAEEDLQGLPFVGQAGKLLTGLITALGLTRDDVYITNVVKCRPPNNRNPEPDEAAACRPILNRQIELLNPGLIVTLGNIPLKALKPGAGGITRERGNQFPYESWRVLPTFHPSYLLRNPSAMGDCWRDFRMAFAIAYTNFPQQ